MRREEGSVRRKEGRSEAAPTRLTASFPSSGSDFIAFSSATAASASSAAVCTAEGLPRRSVLPGFSTSPSPPFFRTPFSSSSPSAHSNERSSAVLVPSFAQARYSLARRRRALSPYYCRVTRRRKGGRTFNASLFVCPSLFSTKVSPRFPLTEIHGGVRRIESSGRGWKKGAPSWTSRSSCSLFSEAASASRAGEHGGDEGGGKVKEEEEPAEAPRSVSQTSSKPLTAFSFISYRLNRLPLRQYRFPRLASH